jgi:hypothetical protein
MPAATGLGCLVTDGGGALILTAADRAKDFTKKPVYIIGTGESVETPMVSQMEPSTPHAPSMSLVPWPSRRPVSRTRTSTIS